MNLSRSRRTRPTTILGHFGRPCRRGGDRKTLPRNGFENWRAAQHAFSHPKIAILGTALVGKVWKTRPTTNDRARELNAFWIQDAFQVPKIDPKMPSSASGYLLDVSAHRFGRPASGTIVHTNCQGAKVR